MLVRSSLEMRDRLRRCAFKACLLGTVNPHSLIDAGGPEGEALVERLAVQPSDLPILICPNGTVLRRPSDQEAGVGLGIVPDIQPGTEYDVIVVGRALQASLLLCMQHRRGLSVLVIDSRSFGGQAGASSRIENYLGFPTGISGQALTARAFSSSAEIRRSICHSGLRRHARLFAATIAPELHL